MVKQTGPPWKPHPPPNPEWPDNVKRIYATGCVRIDKLRRQIGEDGIIPLPFRCYGCDKMSMMFSMLTGDGLPMCTSCVQVPRPDEGDFVTEANHD